MSCWPCRLASQWRWLLVAYYQLRPAPRVQSLVHMHVWGPCRLYGYWYARCVADESCTAKLAC